MREKVLLRSSLSVGDMVMLTAAVRDLAKAHPERYAIDVRTSCAAVWEHNPYLTSFPEQEADRAIDCEYPLIHKSNSAPYHFIHGYRQDLEAKLHIDIPAGPFRGDIHISADEKRWMSQVEESRGAGKRFWIVSAGGKFDYTAKWWIHSRYQAVVDHFVDRILFVQTGETHHYHPPLSNVLDLRGRTDLRQLIRLIYHADGVLCPVTGIMHLAAAIETSNPAFPHRPCVVIAGGREPVQWEAYPHHQFLHTLGALPCCAEGACWRSRVYPLGDGADADRSLCVDVVRGAPRCMHEISAEQVIDRIELYLRGRSS